MVSFVYVQFGEKRYLNQIRLSISTLEKSINTDFDYQVLLYCEYKDKITKDFFGDSSKVMIHNISDGDLAGWTDNRKNIFKAKIKVLQEYFREYSHDVVLVDSDVLFIADIQKVISQLSKNTFLMDFQCRSLITSLRAMGKCNNKEIQDQKILNMKKCYQLLENGIVLDRYRWKADNNTSLYNSGIIGISYANRMILDEVIILEEYLFNNSQYGAVEEVAFSIVFQQYGEIKYIDDILIHYFECKETYYIAGHILGMLSVDEEEYLAKMLEMYSVYDIRKYELTLNEANSFMDYLRLVKGNNEAYFGNEIKAYFYTGDQKLNTWKSENNSRFRKWLRKENS